MKKLLMVISLLVVLVAAVTGCGGAHRYDSRLTAADTLMQPNPDSALAIVEAVCPDSLPDESNRAYRDLLLTQARYRCYVTATSDSDINHALAYYRAHSGEREKLTRAYIYKGAVMDELGHPDSAMLYYKHAEATAASDDYFNLGYTNLRTGDLYRLYFADEQTCYEKFKTALHFFKLTNNKQLQQNCLYNMAMCAGITENEDSDSLLAEALSLANDLADTTLIFDCRELKCRQLTIKGLLAEAKSEGLYCLNNYSHYLNNHILLDMAHIYALEGKNDSALYYLDFVNSNIGLGNKEQIKIRRFEVLSLLAVNEGNQDNRKIYTDSLKYWSESINNRKEKFTIQQIEHLSNTKSTVDRLHEISKLNLFIWVISVCAILITTALVIFFYYKRNRYKAIVKEIEQNGINSHQELLDELGSRNDVIKNFVQNMIQLLQSAIESSSNQRKSISNHEIENIKTLVGDVANEEFWTELHTYMGKRYGGFILEIARNPKITESDLRFIELSCCGFSYLEIAITMGLSPKYMSRKRKEVAQKLGLTVPLQDFIDVNLQRLTESKSHRKQ